jgi:hypothetical protein
MPTRSPEEIRLSVQETRRELEFSLNDLQAKVKELTDWRRQIAEHRDQIVIGAAVAGFVVGVVALRRRRRR